MVKKAGKLFTPYIDSGLLNGTVRAKMLAEGCVNEKKLYKKDIIEADEIYLTNSVIGMVRAKFYK